MCLQTVAGGCQRNGLNCRERGSLKAEIYLLLYLSNFDCERNAYHLFDKLFSIVYIGFAGTLWYCRGAIPLVKHPCGFFCKYVLFTFHSLQRMNSPGVWMKCLVRRLEASQLGEEGSGVGLSNSSPETLERSV